MAGKEREGTFNGVTPFMDGTMSIRQKRMEVRGIPSSLSSTSYTHVEVVHSNAHAQGLRGQHMPLSDCQL